MFTRDMEMLSGFGTTFELLRRVAEPCHLKSQELFLVENFLKHFFILFFYFWILWDSPVSHIKVVFCLLFVLFKSIQSNVCSFKNFSTKVILKGWHGSSNVNIINVEIAIYHFKTRINLLLNMRHNVLSEENIHFAVNVFI